MFCPRCGQQAAEEVRFCSGCGLPLDAAAEIVETGGRPVGELAHAEPRGLTQRQRGVRKGLMILSGGVFFFVVAAFLTAFKEDLFPLLVVAGVLMTAGVMRLLYGLLLEEHAPAAEIPKRIAAAEATRPLAGRAHENSRAAELPPARTIPASFYTRPGADTNDISAPSSVTENTTKLLDSEK